MVEMTDQLPAVPPAFQPADDRSDESTAERLRRLEHTLAALQDTSATEQQLTARVVARVTEQMAAAGPRTGPLPDGLAAGDVTGVGGLVGLAFGANGRPSLAAQTAGGVARGYWDRLGVVREARLTARMYFDPHYRLSRTAQFGVPVVVTLMVLNFFFANSLPLVGPVIERLVLVILSVALYKVLAREAGRYADVLAYLARYGR